MSAATEKRSRPSESNVEHSLRVDRLSVRFRLPDATVSAVTDATFTLAAGECLALVGESGCGKSVLVSALLGLLPGNAEIRGRALLDDLDLLSCGERVLASRIRGRRIGLVPQSPAAHLTPVRTVGSQLRETISVLGTAGRDARAAARRYAGRARLGEQHLDRYPHQLSGGLAQRAATALALAGEPWLLLADEPTTGLDRPLVEATMDELARLRDAGHAILLITHDLTAARRVADRVAVMYASRIVETAPTTELFDQPRHPYTAALLDALPERAFRPLPGFPPELTRLPTGCAFAARCSRADRRCDDRPELVTVADGEVACHHPRGG
ncbi:ABC transporter ATP-binding protein [Micromonospora polyrhachis]|uniref:Nickel import system ATP-binding protein NikD n=1 Tax=Micromonospora polyrhachis TaxID=1282883 RepID=A0A7W7SLS5_9ACTN|nr:ABC transporter ATP-binding protein [Micromonospora polyrhachis]MBB4956786.1 peptide/nickel transport system ATP-binding protein [Micromonospora polyrhachis]